MSQKIEKSSFLRNVLIFQHATSAEEKECIIKFTRSGIDGYEHHYEGFRIRQENNFYFTLKQDGLLKDNLAETKDSIREIQDRLRILYNLAKLEPEQVDDWETLFRNLGNFKIDYREELELLASWMELFSYCALFSKTDIREIMANKYPENNKDKLVERIIKEDIEKDNIKECNIKTINLSSKTSTLIWVKDLITIPKIQEIELKRLCRDYLSHLFVPDFILSFEKKQKQRNPFVNEEVFHYTLQKEYETLLNTIPHNLNSLYINTSEPSENYNQVKKVELNQFLDNEMDEYENNKTSDDFQEELNKNDVNNKDEKEIQKFCYLIQAPIGMGKTTFAINYFCRFAASYFQYTRSPLPLITFGSKIRGTDFHDFIGDKFQDQEEFLNAVRNSTKLNSRKMLLILDGLDECKIQLLHSILEICKELVEDNIFLIITSRAVNRIQQLIQNIIPSVKILEPVYEQPIHWESLGIPSGLIKNFQYLDYFFESSSLFAQIQTPLLINLINLTLEELAENNSDWLNNSQLPLSFNKMMLKYYNQLLFHAKQKDKISQELSLRQLLSAGKAVAWPIFSQSVSHQQEQHIHLLQKIGLIKGTLDHPQFTQKIYEYDFLARCIATGFPKLSNDQIFNVIRDPCNLEFSIGHYALNLVLRNEINPEEEYLSISDSNFDIFTTLYEDNVMYLSQLKAIVWHQRKLGLTPLLEFILKEFKENHCSFERRTFLKTMCSYIPAIQKSFLEHANFDQILQIDVDPNYLSLLIEKISKIPEDLDLNQIYFRLPKGLLHSANPFEVLKQIIPQKLLDFNFLVMIDILFGERAQDFFVHLFVNMFKPTNEDRRYLSTSLNYLELYVSMIINYPNLCPDFNSNPDLQEYLPKFFSKINKKYHLWNIFGPNLDENIIQKNILNLMFKILNSDKNSDDNLYLEGILDKISHISDKLLISYFQTNEEYMFQFIRLVEQSIIDNRIETKMKILILENFYFIFNIFKKDPVLIENAIDFFENQDLIAYLIYDLGIRANFLELRTTLSRKLKQLLRNESKENYLNYIQKGIFHGKWLSQFDRTIFVIIEQSDLNEINFNLEIPFEQMISLYMFSESALNELANRYFISINQNRPNIEIGKILRMYDHDKFIEIFQLMETQNQCFLEFFDRLIHSESTFNDIHDLLTGSNSNSKLLPLFWNGILDAVKKVENIDIFKWSDLFYSLRSLKIPADIAKIIISDRFLCQKFIQLILSLGVIDPSVKDLVYQIIHDQPKIVQDFIREIFKKDLFYGYQILPILFNNFELYEDFIVNEIFTNDIKFYQINITSNTILTPKILNAIINKLSEDDFVRLIPHLINGSLSNEMKTFLLQNASNPKFKYLQNKYFPFDPITWDLQIHAHQQKMISKLNENGINLEN